MCLDYVSDKLPRKKTGYGWKVFHLMGSTAQFMYYRYKRRKAVPLGNWITAAHRHSYSYTTGFHVYLNKPDKPSSKDPRYITIKVRYKGARVCGTDAGIKTVVADHIYVSKSALTRTLITKLKSATRPKK